MPDNYEGLETKLDQAARIVRQSKYLVAMVGAGLSVESGIPPFRGPGGLWTKYGEPPMLAYSEFTTDPKVWWRERLRSEEAPGNPMHELKLAVDQAQPNPGHHVLVELEHRGLLKYTLTQNVDNLHRLAGSELLLEIHGNRRQREGFRFNGLPPRYAECQGVLKMDTVMFGEPIPPGVLQDCWEQTKLCDCMLVVGISGSVNPAAQMPLVARDGGATLIQVNPVETALTQ